MDFRETCTDDMETDFLKMARTSLRISFGIYALLAALMVAPNCHAGLSPENIVVVVNGKSLRSRTIANHYVHLRNIPLTNVIVLKAVPERLKVDLDDFRDRILNPVLSEIEKRGLVRHIRLIAYSGDFPTTVDIREHHDRLKNAAQKKHQRPFASLTGATYFYRFMMADDIGYLGFDSNYYARGPFARTFKNPFAGELGEKFDAAITSATGKEPLVGAKALQRIAKDHPSLAPIWVRAAEAYARGGDEQLAGEMLQNAIASGWSSRAYLDDSDLLKPLLEQLTVQSEQTFGANESLVEGYQGPISFSAAYGWTACGYPVRIQQNGIGYMMSCSLAVLHDRGSKLSESIAVLQRAAKADYSQPRGQFLFTAHSDVRAKTREHGIKFAKEGIDSLGLDADVIKTTMPTTSQTVTGLMVGSPEVDFSDRKWKFAPGAVAESLTSLGGAFGNRKQTKLTDYLHAGAAISSGAVVEPYSIQAKFPHPMMYCYYAQGMSAIESYFLSVLSPYQLLIVGDPACQPFAVAPPVLLDISQTEAEDDAQRQVSILARPIPNALFRMADSRNIRVRAVEVYLNGRFQQSIPLTKRIHLKLPPESVGVLSVRAVLVGQDSSEPRVSFHKELDLKGDLPTPVAKIVQGRNASKSLSDDGAKAKAITIALRCKGADTIDVMHAGVVVGTCKGDEGTVKINAKRLGAGPLSFQVIARFGDRNVNGFIVTDAPGVTTAMSK